MHSAPSNMDDVLDTRDIIERIAELEAELEGAVADTTAGTVTSSDGETDLTHEAAELLALKALQDEAEGYCPDWQYGATLIRDSYWIDYVQELLEDIGGLPKEMPSYIVIDWEATARNIQFDYTSVAFDGVTYWVR